MGLPERYEVVLVMFAAAATCYMDRVGFPLAYTAMAAAAGVDKETQGLVHSAFYNGYTLSQARGAASSQVQPRLHEPLG
jgi:sugar phosphate permease